MAINWNRYKTYDTAQGFGNNREWKKAFAERMFTAEQVEAILTKSKKTPHDILGVAATASAAEIKKAWRKLAHEWHPDKHNGSREAHERFLEIQAAYEKLIP